MNNKNQMFRKIENTKLTITSFIADHPKVVMYGISLGVTLGISIALAFVTSYIETGHVYQSAFARSILCSIGAKCRRYADGGPNDDCYGPGYGCGY